MEALTFTFSANGSPRRETCKQCRLRKVRCHGHTTDSDAEPCLNCKRLDFTCSFSVDDVGEKTQSSSKPEPRRVSKACSRCRQHKIRCSGTNPCSSCRRRTLTCDYPAPSKRKQLSVDAGNAQSPGEDSDMATLTSPLEPREDRHVDNRGGPGSRTDLPQATIAATTPIHDSLSPLMDFFFQQVYPLPSYSFLHPGTINRRYREGTLESCLACAIFAVASVRAPPSIRQADSEAAWAEQAEASVWENLESPSIARLQAILLVVLYRAETNQLRRAFMLSALAGRAAAAMRLNHERPGPNTLNHEIRRRLMWSLKFVERYFSIGLPEFELCPVENLYIQLPCSEDKFVGEGDPPDLCDDMGTYNICVKLEMLRRDVMKLTRSLALCDEPYPHLPQVMRDFQNNLDKIGKQMPGGSNITAADFTNRLVDRWLPRHLLMRLSWHQCHCDLYRLLLRDFREAAPKVIVEGMDPATLDAAEEACIYHAKSIAQFLAILNHESQQFRLLEFDSAICAYNVSRLLLFTARFGRTSHSPSEDFSLNRAELCLSSLRRFFPRSTLVRPIAEEMRRLIDEAASNVTLAPSRLGSPRSSVLPDRDLTMQLSAAAKTRQRLAIHSLLRQAAFSDDDDDDDEDPDESEEARQPSTASLSNFTLPSIRSSAGKAQHYESATFPTELSKSKRPPPDGPSPQEVQSEGESWQHNLLAGGDLLHGWDMDASAPVSAPAASHKSFSFPWLQREQAAVDADDT